MLVHMQGSRPAPPASLRAQEHEEPAGEAGLAGWQAGEKQGWKHRVPFGQPPRGFPTCRGTATSLRREKRRLRGREGFFQQLLVLSFPLALWGCLEGSTSHFPLRPVPTTKPPSRSLTRSDNVPSWVLAPRAGGSSPPGETAVLTLRLGGGGGKTPGGLRVCRGGWMRRTRRHRACPARYGTC